MFHRVRPAAILLSAAVALTSIPLAANAQTKSIRVHSYDLDLSTGAGQAELQRRIDRAVDRACGPAVGARMDELASSASCSKVARANAMTQYDAVVRAAHNATVATRQNQDVILR
jgi:UrcA family protein